MQIVLPDYAFLSLFRSALRPLLGPELAADCALGKHQLYQSLYEQSALTRLAPGERTPSSDSQRDSAHALGREAGTPLSAKNAPGSAHEELTFSTANQTRNSLTAEGL